MSEYALAADGPAWRARSLQKCVCTVHSSTVPNDDIYDDNQDLFLWKCEMSKSCVNTLMTKTWPTFRVLTFITPSAESHLWSCNQPNYDKNMAILFLTFLILTPPHLPFCHCHTRQGQNGLTERYLLSLIKLLCRTEALSIAREMLIIATART